MYRAYLQNQRLGRAYNNFTEARQAVDRATRRDHNGDRLELWEIDQDGRKLRCVHKSQKQIAPKC